MIQIAIGGVENTELKGRLSFDWLSADLHSTYQLSSDSGHLICTARRLAYEIRERCSRSQRTFVYVHDSEVWPSATSQVLLDAVYKFSGIDFPVSTHPILVFNADEHDAVELLLTVALLFFWDVLVETEDKQVVFHVSHHSVLEVLSPTFPEGTWKTK